MYSYLDSVYELKIRCIKNQPNYIGISLSAEEGDTAYIFIEHEAGLTVLFESETVETEGVVIEELMPDQLPDKLIYILTNCTEDENVFIKYDGGRYIIRKVISKLTLFGGELQLMSMVGSTPIVKVNGIVCQGYAEISQEMWGNSSYNQVGFTMRYIKPLLQDKPKEESVHYYNKFDLNDFYDCYQAKSKMGKAYTVFAHTQLGQVHGIQEVIYRITGNVTVSDVVSVCNKFGVEVKEGTVRQYIRNKEKGDIPQAVLNRHGKIPKSKREVFKPKMSLTEWVIDKYQIQKVEDHIVFIDPDDDNEEYTAYKKHQFINMLMGLDEEEETAKEVWDKLM